MNPRTILFAVIALTMAGATAFLIQGWMRSQVRQAPVAEKRKPVEVKTEILVARKSMPAGHLVKPDDLEWRQWPKKGVAKSYVVKDKGKGGINDFVGAVVRYGVSVGEPISQGRVAKPGDRGFMAAVLSPGMRAVSVPVNATSGIAGFIFPGDRVDMILSHNVKGGDDVARVSETILTNIRVLAVDQKTDDQQSKPAVAKTATLEVTPKQVEMIAVAVQIGRISFSLRSLAAKDGAKKGASAPTARGARGRTYTRDREVSRLIRGGSKKKREDGSVVQVFRGSTGAAESVGNGAGGALPGVVGGSKGILSASKKGVDRLRGKFGGTR